MRGLIVLGFGAIVALFLLYGRYQDPELLTPDAIGTIQRIAHLFYVALAAALGAVGLGLYRYHRSKAESGGAGLTWIIASSTWNGRSRRIFMATFVCYGAFFSLLSGTLVYQPEVSFTEHYGAVVPSGFVAPCCDAPGYMPKAIIYVTDHVGLQVVPINLVLQVAVSYLVGLNVAMAFGSSSAFGRGMGGAGAACGLFVGCPTCAGGIFSVFLGAAGGIAVAAAVTQLQTAFIAASIPVLLLTPYIMARRIGRRAAQ